MPPKRAFLIIFLANKLLASAVVEVADEGAGVLAASARRADEPRTVPAEFLPSQPVIRRWNEVRIPLQNFIVNSYAAVENKEKSELQQLLSQIDSPDENTRSYIKASNDILNKFLKAKDEQIMVQAYVQLIDSLKGEETPALDKETAKYIEGEMLKKFNQSSLAEYVQSVNGQVNQLSAQLENSKKIIQQKIYLRNPGYRAQFEAVLQEKIAALNQQVKEGVASPPVIEQLRGGTAAEQLMADELTKRMQTTLQLERAQQALGEGAQREWMSEDGQTVSRGLSTLEAQLRSRFPTQTQSVVTTANNALPTLTTATARVRTLRTDVVREYGASSDADTLAALTSLKMNKKSGSVKNLKAEVAHLDAQQKTVASKLLSAGKSFWQAVVDDPGLVAFLIAMPILGAVFYIAITSYLDKPLHKNTDIQKLTKRLAALGIDQTMLTEGDLHALLQQIINSGESLASIGDRKLCELLRIALGIPDAPQAPIGG